MEDELIHPNDVGLLCDRQSVICLSKDQVFHDKTKHIDMRYYFIRTKKIEVKKIDIADNCFWC